MAMDDSLVTLNYLQYGVPILTVWLIKELYSNYKAKYSGQESATKENTVAILALDKNISTLQGDIRVLVEQLKPLESMPHEIKKVYERLRILEKKA